MENKKTEKKRIFSKLTVCVAALALVSCAFVGGTFARYTTGQTTANGGANIADWYIDVENGADSGSEDQMLTISPYHIAWEEGTGQQDAPRKNAITTGGISMRVTNKGQVWADVKITLGNTLGVYTKSVEDGALVTSEDALVVGNTYTDRAGNTYQWTGNDTDGYKPSFTKKGEDVPKATYDALVAAWEEMTLYKGSSPIITVGDLSIEKIEETGQGETVTENGGVYSATLATGDYVEIQVDSATWTSDIADAEDGDNGDIRDTWIGENIAMIGYTITWSAVQSSDFMPGTVSGGDGTSAP